MSKIKNIEFLRVFLISTIVLLHMFIDRVWCLCTLFPDVSLYQNIKFAIAKANNSVEGFFLIAGFLLLLTFKHSESVLNFIKKKYIRLSPVICFSILICVFGWLLGTMHFKLIPNLLTMFLLNNFGYCWAAGNNPILWFTSALFAGLLVYFLIIKYVPKKYFYGTVFSLSCLAYIILENLQHGSFAKPIFNYGIFNIGFLRAIGGIGLGCFIAQLYKDNISTIESFKPKKIMKFLFSGFEILLFCFIVWWTTIKHIALNNILFVIGFAGLLSLFVCKKGLLSNLVDKDIWVFWGKYQYSLYVIHYVIIRIYGLALWKQNPDFIYAHPVLPIFIMLFTIILFTVLVYHFVEEPCAKYLKQKLFNNSKTLVNTDISGGGNG